MKIGKKAKSTAAVLAVMALTAGFSGVQAERVAVHDPLFGGPYVDSNEMGKALGIDSMQNDIGNLQTQITNVAEQANGAYNGMTQNAQDIDALQTQVGENTTDIADLQGTVADHQTQITNVAEQANAAFNGMTQNTQDISDLQTQVGQNTTDIAGLQDTVADHQTQINTIADQASDAEAKADGALKVQGNGVLYNHGTDLTTGINLNTSAIEQEIKDRETADQNLQSQITENADTIADVADQASDAEAKADGALKVQGNGVLYNHGTDLTTGINLNTMAIEQEVKDRETADQQLQQGINTNTAAINSVKTTVGSGILTSGAADLTTGINQNYAQIQQNYAQIQQNTNAINDLDNRVDDLDNEIDQVGAVSAALAGLHPLDYDGTGSKFQLSAAVGSYDSTQAAAIGAFYHFNRDVMVSLGGATSFDGDHKTAGNLGVTFRIGAGASGKSVSDDVMARLEAMDQKIAALEQENKDLKNVLGAIDTSLSKEFPDVPANHWAYEAVSKLAGNDIVSGYPDGEFHGDRTMTRYEMAEIIYKAMNRGVQVDQKLVEEFKPEMEQVAANQNA
ncbi:S-layer homology domain-containing protein [uncultured Megasphaera sp.]|uniref:S-layer homology domain-containing protein n=1 Tax=uncultured Megasphaera sp. TaxID=165188 RepID=UPI002670170F|nr:S-layer homology domain-containing protein [uncultured Megasphaera sp.]